MDLKNRVAIVTGGARGIGLAIVEDLRSHGASVVIVDAGVSISGEPLEPRIAEQVAARMEGTAAVCGDIAQSETAQQAVRLAQERFGGVDILVNNAAIIRDAFIFKADPPAWDAVLRTNLTGAYRLLATASPVMREQAKSGRAPGSIVNIVSTAGFYGNFGQGAYAAAKARRPGGLPGESAQGPSVLRCAAGELPCERCGVPRKRPIIRRARPGAVRVLAATPGATAAAASRRIRARRVRRRRQGARAGLRRPGHRSGGILRRPHLVRSKTCPSTPR